jgi:hypothetical protein
MQRRKPELLIRLFTFECGTTSTPDFKSQSLDFGPALCSGMQEDAPSGFAAGIF